MTHSGMDRAREGTHASRARVGPERLRPGDVVRVAHGGESVEATVAGPARVRGIAAPYYRLVTADGEYVGLVSYRLVRPLRRAEEEGR